MKKVLIAIDYNPISEKVAEVGHKLARTLGAEICLIHVTTTVSYYGMEYPVFLGYEGYDEVAVDLSIASERRKVAEDFVRAAAMHLDPSVKTHIAEGDTPQAILEYSKEWNADLIVMGTHSHSVLEKLLMGTVASRILEKTDIPVYMVPVKK